MDSDDEIQVPKGMTDEIAVKQGDEAFNMGNLKQALQLYDMAILISEGMLQALVAARNDVKEKLGALDDDGITHEVLDNVKHVIAVYFQRRAKCLIAMGELESAIAVYDQCIKMHPSTYVYHHEKGIVHKDLTQFPEAISELEESTRLNKKPDNPSLLALGQVYVQIRHYQRALEHVNTFYQTNRDHPVAKKLIEEILDNKRSFGERHKKFTDFLSKARYHFTAAEYDAAIEQLNEAHTLMPDRVEVIVEKAKIYQALNQTHQMEDAQRQALEILEGKVKTSSEEDMTSDEELDSDEYDVIKIMSTKEKHGASLARRRARLAEIYVLMGSRAAGLMGMEDEALKNYSGAIDLCKQLPQRYADAKKLSLYELYLKRASLYSNVKKYESAILDYRECLKYNPDEKKKMDEIIVKTQAKLIDQVMTTVDDFVDGDRITDALEKVKELLNIGIERKSLLADLHTTIARLYTEIEKHESTVEHLTTALEIIPQPTCHLFSARCSSYFALEKYDEAYKDGKLIIDVHDRESELPTRPPRRNSTLSMTSSIGDPPGTPKTAARFSSGNLSDFLKRGSALDLIHDDSDKGSKESPLFIVPDEALARAHYMCALCKLRKDADIEEVVERFSKFKELQAQRGVKLSDDETRTVNEAVVKKQKWQEHIEEMERQRIEQEEAEKKRLAELDRQARIDLVQNTSMLDWDHGHMQIFLDGVCGFSDDSAIVKIVKEKGMTGRQLAECGDDTGLKLFGINDSVLEERFKIAKEIGKIRKKNAEVNAVCAAAIQKRYDQMEAEEKKEIEAARQIACEKRIKTNHMREWRCADVIYYVEKHMPQIGSDHEILQLFKNRNVDGEILLKLRSDENLKAFGVSDKHMEVRYNLAKKLREETSKMGVSGAVAPLDLSLVPKDAEANGDAAAPLTPGLRTKPMASWTTADVAAFLEGPCASPNLIPILNKHNVDGSKSIEILQNQLRLQKEHRIYFDMRGSVPRTEDTINTAGSTSHRFYSTSEL